MKSQVARMPEKLLALLTALAVVAGLALVFAPTAQGVSASCATAQNWQSFTFNFVNGVTISGDNCPGSPYAVDQDGNSQESFLPGTGGHTNALDGPGMQLHTSCSATYEDGWGKPGNQPDETNDSAWEIASFSIQKFHNDDAEPHTTCIQPWDPPPTTGKIIVEKEVTEGSDTSKVFSFTESGFVLDDNTLADGEMGMSGDVAPGGVYSVSESVPTGWTLQSATCDDANSTPADINVEAGETVTCTFTNSEDSEPPPRPPTDPPTTPTPQIKTTSVCELMTSKFVVSTSNVGTVDVLVGIVWNSGSTSDDLKPGEVLSATIPAGENWTVFENGVPAENGLAESCDEVAGTTITVAPTTVAETLPFTGVANGTPVALAMALIAGGALALVWAKQLQIGRHESSDG